MNDIADLIGLVRDELGLAVTTADADRELADLPGWDSMHLLWLVDHLERTTGRTITVIDLLEASTLEHIWAVVTGGSADRDD